MMDCWTCTNKSDEQTKSAEATMTSDMASSTAAPGASYTSNFVGPQKKKSKGFRSREFGGKLTCLPSLIHLSRNVLALSDRHSLKQLLDKRENCINPGFLISTTAFQISAFVWPLPLSGSSSSQWLLLSLFSLKKRGLRFHVL
ncbi:hypothetical protein TNCV_72751 [Trichonephila clavipes]|uniref:Uncharacterized protein n=1 Tax=Trichonephila clavipes TaxID=2585209 RepID=A0A8X6UZC8_TRICX|nr:hypothetical protein TNCV_72751 [Trichonephila clavipes]